MTISTMQEPPLIKGHPLFGHLLQMRREGIHFYERMFRENGDAMRIRVLHKTFYLFLHPDHNKEILIDKSDTFIKGNQYRNLRLILGNGLLTSNGSSWLRQRKLLNPLFGREALDVHLQYMSKVAADKINELKDGEHNWTNKMFEFTIEVAVQTFFGSALNSENKDKFNKASVNAIRVVSRRMASPLNLPLIIPTAANRALKEDLKFLKSTVLNIIKQRKKNQNSNNDMLDMLMKAKDDDQSSLSESDVFDQILTFLFAGHETTAMTMSWLFYELSRHPEVQNKIIEECERNSFLFNTTSHLNNYSYLVQVLNETMRLYPAGWIIARDINEDSTVGQFRVKKNNVLAVCPYINHRDQRWWDAPDKFNPDRFEKDPEKNTFLPFSLGKRNCIGGRFALIEMAVFCIEFFKSRRISPGDQLLTAKGFVTLKPSSPVKIHVIKR